MAACPGCPTKGSCRFSSGMDREAPKCVLPLFPFCALCRANTSAPSVLAGRLDGLLNQISRLPLQRDILDKHLAEYTRYLAECGALTRRA